MFRRLALASLVCFVASQLGLAADNSKSLSVTGNYPGGVKISASCTVTSIGQASGEGRLTGTNNGTAFSYPFTVTAVKTAKGTVTLSGNFKANNAPVTLTAAVPKGAQTFKYVVNGKTVTQNGQGTVTVK